MFFQKFEQWRVASRGVAIRMEKVKRRAISAIIESRDKGRWEEGTIHQKVEFQLA
jgi:hypothetical protein